MKHIQKLTTFLPQSKLQDPRDHAFRIRQTREELLFENRLIYLSGNHFILDYGTF